MTFVDAAEARRIASLELAALPGKLTAGEARPRILDDAPTPIYDPNGEILCLRYTTEHETGVRGHLDLTGRPILGSPMLSAALGSDWNPRKIRVESLERGLKADPMRFVAYSYPKLALEVPRPAGGVQLLDIVSWNPVPDPEHPSHYFLVQSLLDSLTLEDRARNAADWEERVDLLRNRARGVPEKTIEYHGPELCWIEQEQDQWCAAASVQMILKYHKNPKLQTDVATALKLYDANGMPIRLPSKPASYALVEETLTDFSVQTCSATKEGIVTKGLATKSIANPSWDETKAILEESAPTFGLIPGHAQVVAGYSESVSNGISTGRQLRVYDPWGTTKEAIMSFNLWTQTRFIESRCSVHPPP